MASLPHCLGCPLAVLAARLYGRLIVHHYGALAARLYVAVQHNAARLPASKPRAGSKRLLTLW